MSQSKNIEKIIEVITLAWKLGAKYGSIESNQVAKVLHDDLIKEIHQDTVESTSIDDESPFYDDSDLIEPIPQFESDPDELEKLEDQSDPQYDASKLRVDAKIHIKSKAGIYTVYAINPPNMFLRTKSFNSEFTVPITDFKCFAGGSFN